MSWTPSRRLGFRPQVDNQREVSQTMNHEIALKWAEALESGKYRQGLGLLRSADDTYCCLGVLCELAIESGVRVHVEPSNDFSHFSHSYYKYNGCSAALPHVVQKWADVTANPVLSRKDDIARLTASFVNDTQSLTFPQIAAIIRQNFVEASGGSNDG